jgi:predicted aspartyl protease
MPTALLIIGIILAACGAAIIVFRHVKSRKGPPPLAPTLVANTAALAKPIAAAPVGLAPQLARLETEVETYCRHDPVADAKAESATAVAAYNSWADTERERLAAERAAVDEDLKKLRALESEIEQTDQRLKQERAAATDDAAIAAYNRRVAECNALVTKQRALATAFQSRQDALNRRIDEFNTEAQQRQDKADKVQEGAVGKATAYRQWIQRDGPEELFRAVNAAFAQAMAAVRVTDPARPEQLALAARARRLRADLAAYARAAQAKREHSMLLVDAQIGGESCLVMVDNGATVCSLSDELVDALGIRAYVGEEVELTLPNNLRIKVPQLLIPEIDVAGQRSEFVKSVVLKPPMAGVDGSLGLSFLQRFEYTIDKRRLTLDLAPRAVAATTVGFDVFICHKSDDYTEARKVYDVLEKAGRRAFLYEITRQQAVQPDVTKAVDDVLELSRHLVLICSSRERIESPWLAAEWRSFESLRRAGLKTGHLVPVLCGKMTREQLPASLHRYASVSLLDSDWEQKLLASLPQ